MRALLTSAGIKNSSIHDALVDLLDKPIAESNALFIPTAVYPFPGGPGMAWRAIRGNASSPLCELGWKSLGVLELTALRLDRSHSDTALGGGLCGRERREHGCCLHVRRDLRPTATREGWTAEVGGHRLRHVPGRRSPNPCHGTGSGTR